MWYNFLPPELRSGIKKCTVFEKWWYFLPPLLSSVSVCLENSILKRRTTIYGYLNKNVVEKGFEIW
jgi:hypothetical protein